MSAFVFHVSKKGGSDLAMYMPIMILLPIAAGIVSFAAAIYGIGHYRARYESSEFRAALAVGIGMFVLFSLSSIGERISSGKSGEDIIGGIIILNAALTAFAVIMTLRKKVSSGQ